MKKETGGPDKTASLKIHNRVAISPLSHRDRQQPIDEQVWATLDRFATRDLKKVNRVILTRKTKKFQCFMHRIAGDVTKRCSRLLKSLHRGFQQHNTRIARFCDWGTEMRFRNKFVHLP